MMKVPPDLLKLIHKNKNFLIVTHINPDGDAIGSVITLALGLKKLGKYVYVLSKSPVPDILKFLPRSELIKTRIPSMEFDVLLIVDCNTLERTGFSHLSARNTAIIDHHLIFKHVFKHDKKHIHWEIPEASATGELIYNLLNALRIPINKETATNLYTAIYMDTGGFQYSNTSVESLRIGSHLIKTGANPWNIAKEVYENISLPCFRLLTLTLSTLEKHGKIALVTVTRHMFKKTKTSAQDTENFADHPRKIKGVEVGILLREDAKNSFKVSLRSKGKVNVAYIAKAFGGGGHAAAAGFKLDGTLPEVKNKVLRAVRKALKK